jgi:hypothetical protein
MREVKLGGQWLHFHIHSRSNHFHKYNPTVVKHPCKHPASYPAVCLWGSQRHAVQPVHPLHPPARDVGKMPVGGCCRMGKCRPKCQMPVQRRLRRLHWSEIIQKLVKVIVNSWNLERNSERFGFVVDGRLPLRNGAWKVCAESFGEDGRTGKFVQMNINPVQHRVHPNGRIGTVRGLVTQHICF